MTIIECISNLKNVYHGHGAKKEAIDAAEKKLNLHFADEYREYVSMYGIISAKGTELTGIIDSKRLNVADVTLQERELNTDFPPDMYVIANIAIDGILMLQKSDGGIYELSQYSQPVKKYDSLAKYLASMQ